MGVSNVTPIVKKSDADTPLKVVFLFRVDNSMLFLSFLQPKPSNQKHFLKGVTKVSDSKAFLIKSKVRYKHSDILK